MTPKPGLAVRRLCLAVGVLFLGAYAAPQESVQRYEVIVASPDRAAADRVNDERR